MFTIKPIESRAQWETFLHEVPPNTFLQSWQWGEFNERMASGSESPPARRGERVWRLGIYEGNTLCAVALIIKVQARRGSFLFCPHGPISMKAFEHRSMGALVDYVRQLARGEGCSFIRFSPLMLKTAEHDALWHELGFREAPIHMHPELAWILDITPSAEQLLQGMRKTTRYSIKKSEKDGVDVTMHNNPGDLDTFWNIYEQTVSRHHFTPFSKQYLRTEFEAFAAQNNAAFFFGRYRGEVISAAFVVFQPWSAFYHHGASTPKYANVPASQLIQWHAILEAKRRGCARYNFWGIAPEHASNHPWAGLTLFKKGFGGYAEEYVHAKDLILNQKYWLTYSIEKIRKIKRRL